MFLRVASRPRVKLVSCKSALNPRWFTLPTVLRRWSRCWSYSLLLCGLFYGAICFMSYLVPFCSWVFSPFSIAITSLGEERANLYVFRTFVRFVLVWICRFPLPLGVWEGLRFVIVARPGLFSYLVRDCGTSWTFPLPFYMPHCYPIKLMKLNNA